MSTDQTTNELLATLIAKQDETTTAIKDLNDTLRHLVNVHKQKVEIAKSGDWKLWTLMNVAIDAGLNQGILTSDPREENATSKKVVKTSPISDSDTGLGKLFK